MHDTTDTPAPTELPDAEPGAATDAAPEAAADATQAVAMPAPAARMAPEECAAQLKQRFPALFAGQPKPIKLHIQADIQARAPGVFTKQVLSAFLRRHTGSRGYLLALTRSPHRLDLDGQPAGEVTDVHRQAAQEELKRREQMFLARRQEEDEQRRQRARLLREWQTTTLTRANFCALKGVPEASLDGLLERARQEAQERAAAPHREGAGHRPERHERHERPGGPGPRRDGPGPRSRPGGARPPRPPRPPRSPDAA